MDNHYDKIYSRRDRGADERVKLCAAVGPRGGQTSRRGCLYLSSEGHARVRPPLSGGLDAVWDYRWTITMTRYTGG